MCLDLQSYESLGPRTCSCKRRSELLRRLKTFLETCKWPWITNLYDWMFGLWGPLYTGALCSAGPSQSGSVPSKTRLALRSRSS